MIGVILIILLLLIIIAAIVFGIIIYRKMTKQQALNIKYQASKDPTTQTSIKGIQNMVSTIKTAQCGVPIDTLQHTVQESIDSEFQTCVQFDKYMEENINKMLQAIVMQFPGISQDVLKEEFDKINNAIKQTTCQNGKPNIEKITETVYQAICKASQSDSIVGLTYKKSKDDSTNILLQSITKIVQEIQPFQCKQIKTQIDDMYKMLSSKPMACTDLDNSVKMVVLMLSTILQANYGSETATAFSTQLNDIYNASRNTLCSDGTNVSPEGFQKYANNLYSSLCPV
jgi:hypothetical protein